MSFTKKSFPKMIMHAWIPPPCVERGLEKESWWSEGERERREREGERSV